MAEPCKYCGCVWTSCKEAEAGHCDVAEWERQCDADADGEQAGAKSEEPK